MPQKRIADRRIYGYDAHGRWVLLALPGHPIPPGVDEPAPPPQETQITRVANKARRNPKA